MPTQKQVKSLILDSLRQTITRETLSFIAKTKEPEEKEYDLIAARNIGYLFIPREYEKLRKDWEWATGKEIPVSFKEALDYMDHDIKGWD